jgi:hypothetical protein
MPKTSRQLLAIARFSFMELLGTPAVLLMMLTASLGTLVLPLLQFQRFSEDGRLARDCGLATAFLFGLFLIAGSAGRLRRVLTDGTAAIAFVKPLSRGVWFVGQILGAAGMLVWFLLAMSAAVLTAESFSPQYHTTGAYANVSGILKSLLFPIGALLLGALNNRLRQGRFALTAALALPPLLWSTLLLTDHLHWGILTFPPIIFCFLAQLLTLASAAAMVLPIGMTTCVAIGGAFIALLLPGGAAWLPLDLLAYGGAVPFKTLLLVFPQAVAATGFFLWIGVRLLCKKESV